VEEGRNTEKMMKLEPNVLGVEQGHHQEPDLFADTANAAGGAGERLASTRPGRAQRDDGWRWRAQGRRMSAKEQRDARRGRAAVATAAVQGQGGGGGVGAGEAHLPRFNSISMTDGPTKK
jgi:hypothetical protein